MEGKKGYTTRQRKAILDYLTARPEELFSAEELMLALRKREKISVWPPCIVIWTNWQARIF